MARPPAKGPTEKAAAISRDEILETVVTARPFALHTLMYETTTDRVIGEAVARGEFDRLPGAGQPIDLDENPFAGDWAMAFRMLKNARHTLPWITLANEIDADRAKLRELLDQARRHLEALRAARVDEAAYRAARDRWRDRYLADAAKLDRKLAEFDIQVPSRHLGRGRLPAHIAVQRFDAACPSFSEPAPSEPAPSVPTPSAIRSRSSIR